MESNSPNTTTSPAENVIEDGGLMVTVTDSFGQTGGDDENAAPDDSITG
jgi:hypothetical protein